MLPRFKEDLKGFDMPSSIKAVPYTEKDIQEGLERMIKYSNYRPKDKKIIKKKMISTFQKIINDLK